MGAREVIWNTGNRNSVDIPSSVSDRWREMLSPSDSNFHFKEPYFPSLFRRFLIQASVHLVELFKGPVRTHEPSLFLTQQCKRLLHYLVERNIADYMVLSLPHTTEPPFYYFFLRSPFCADLTDGDQPRVLGLGRGFSSDYDTAVSTAFGETLERIPFLYYRNSDFVTATPEELESRGEMFVDPEIINAYSTKQRELFPKRGQISPQSPFRWLVANRLRSSADTGGSDTALLPVQLIFWKYKRMRGAP